MGHNSYKNWRKFTTLELDIKYSKTKSYAKISAQYVKAWKRKARKTVYSQYSKFQKGHNSHKNWRNLTTPELDQ